MDERKKERKTDDEGRMMNDGEWKDRGRTDG